MSDLDPELGAVMTIAGKYYSRYNPNRDVKTFWSAAKKKQLMIKRCRDCKASIHPSRLCCPRCLSMQLDWEQASGKGSVYTYTVISYPYVAELKDKVPYALALVQLDEGVIFYSWITGCRPAEVSVGMKVEAVFDDDNMLHIVLPKFRPTSKS